MTSTELRKIRKSKGLTMAEASRIFNIRYRTWQNWENGSRRVPDHISYLLFTLKNRRSKMNKILIVEDDARLRESIEQLLLMLDLEPKIATNTTEADEIMLSYTPDLVITDHDLGPGHEKGVDFAIRVKNTGIPVCIHSGNYDAKDQAMEEGIPFFLKPSNMIEIIEYMRLMINEG